MELTKNQPCQDQEERRVDRRSNRCRVSMAVEMSFIGTWPGPIMDAPVIEMSWNTELQGGKSVISRYGKDIVRVCLCFLPAMDGHVRAGKWAAELKLLTLRLSAVFWLGFILWFELR